MSKPIFLDGKWTRKATVSTFLNDVYQIDSGTSYYESTFRAVQILDWANKNNYAYTITQELNENEPLMDFYIIFKNDEHAVECLLFFDNIVNAEDDRLRDWRK